MFRLFISFYGLKRRYKYESQKSKNLLVLCVSNFLFMIYPGLDLAIVRPRAWVQYDLTYTTLGKAKQVLASKYTVLFALKMIRSKQPYFPGAISIMFYQHLFQNHMTSGLNFFTCITVNVRVGLSSEREAATAKYVRVNKLVK